VVDNGKALINHSVVDNGKALINHSVVDNFDMLMPEIGEVVGGSMRETDYDELKSRMIEMGINPESLQFYLDLRKYGTISHGGSGIGFDRLMLAITGMHNIRDMIPFPRSYETCHY
jgi:asparaginyl-tRNA synthetase